LTRALRIGVIALPHVANFTDFDPLGLEPAVSLAYLERPSEMASADLLILPGSKQTLDDLQWLEQGGFARELHRLYGIGMPIIGICGGFQMLGHSIEDPHGIENQGTPIRRAGLALLGIRTVLQPEKTVRRVRGRLQCDFFSRGSPPEQPFEGYEIHVGKTFYESGARPLADLAMEETPDSVPDGAISDSGRVLGTYVHGFFDKDAFRYSFIDAARAAVGLAPAAAWADVAAGREARIDRLAGYLRESLEMDLIKSWIVSPSSRHGKGADAKVGVATYE
jgi:adenosylcobyric acid synthase